MQNTGGGGNLWKTSASDEARRLRPGVAPFSHGAQECSFPRSEVLLRGDEDLSVGRSTVSTRTHSSLSAHAFSALPQRSLRLCVGFFRGFLRQTLWNVRIRRRSLATPLE